MQDEKTRRGKREEEEKVRIKGGRKRMKEGMKRMKEGTKMNEERN